VLACGANPVPLRVPGAEAALSLRSFADAIILRMAARTADSAVVIGGGLIGCEAAACLAGRRVPAEHWRDAAQQGLVAGLSVAGHAAAWNKVPEFSCTIGESTLKYRGWGAGYEHSRLVDHHNGFTVYYQAGDELVGVLTLNADDDYRRATTSLVAGTSSTAR
jgi:NADPH-dependent 2,4-dienoyl-CoA reductase/sulfur reductase-like enzyme